MYLKNYLEQHRTLEEDILVIKRLLNENDLEKNAAEIALHISTLAGKIKVHLSMEDKYLYPDLQKSVDHNIRNMAAQYQDEMGNLAETFVAFKDKYNTKNKIMKNHNSIRQDVIDVFSAIEHRIQKEEKELYRFISK